MSLVLDPDCTWSAYVGGKKVPDTCDALARFRSSLSTDEKLSCLIKTVNNAVLCPGIQMRNLSLYAR